MVSRNKYAFCWDKRNLSSPPFGKRDSNSESCSCGDRTNPAPGIAATPAAATAAAPASKSLRLENTVELMEVLLWASAVPFVRGGRRHAQAVIKAAKIIVFLRVCCQHPRPRA